MSCEQICRRKQSFFVSKLSVAIVVPMYALAQILNHLLLDVITFINEKSKELCAYVSILNVLKMDCVHG